jgi:hypothetical protein
MQRGCTPLFLAKSAEAIEKTGDDEKAFCKECVSARKQRREICGFAGRGERVRKYRKRRELSPKVKALTKNVFASY